jgi:hypothetical protein
MLLSPQPASHTPGEALSAAQCAAWRSDGAVFLSELLPPALADGIVEAAAVLTDPERGGPLRFPHMRRIALCNDAALEPRLLRAAAQLLGVEDDQLRLTQSVVNADFAGQSSGAADPAMHRDLEENSLVALLAEPDAPGSDFQGSEERKVQSKKNETRTCPCIKQRQGASEIENRRAKKRDTPINGRPRVSSAQTKKAA